MGSLNPASMVHVPLFGLGGAPLRVFDAHSGEETCPRPPDGMNEVTSSARKNEYIVVDDQHAKLLSYEAITR